MTNKTAEFLGPEYSWSDAQIELSDVQALSGGVRVLLPSWTIGQMFISRFAPGGGETKYKLAVDWDLKKELCRLCVAQDFVTIRPPERMGLPDEVRPQITLTNERGERHTVAKWAGEPDARFDAVYEPLRALAERMAGQRPMAQRFEPWQQGLVVGAVVVALLLIAGLGYAAGQPLVAAWWPERLGLLFVLLVLLMALLLGAMALVGQRERRKMRWDRPVTNPLMLAAVNLLFFVALVCAVGLVETALADWRGQPPIAGDERVLYARLAYAAVLGAWLAVLAAGLVGARVLRVVEERF